MFNIESEARYNSFVIVRTRKGSTVGCTTIVTKPYIKKNTDKYKYKSSYICNSFDIYENVGGDIFVKMYIKMECGIEIENTICFEKGTVTKIDMETEVL